ncbi:DNA helicase [Lithospermum erythrorhizon]|uniref:ATP-dependent DNA helicase n=1 Tax=Lithospermum erythrorhizon TaxID=34254 RepID=A0AAV3Q2R2_LITER
MVDKSIIEALNNLLQELCENKLIFGGRLVVFGGDFRQVLPVVPGGTRKEQVEASVVTCTLCNHFIKLRLTDNMRARDDPGFINFLLTMERLQFRVLYLYQWKDCINGEEPTNDNGKIAIPRPILIPYTSVEQSLELLIAYVYPQMEMFQSDPFEMMKRTILCPKNEFVDDINHRLIDRLQGNQVVYTSDDRAKSAKDQGDYVDYLNTLEPKGLPQHKLILKINSPIILLRNINPVEGLCNGTRLICKTLLPNVVGAIIATGQFRGKHVWIQKIPLEPNPSDSKYLIPFIRRQIPVRLCFAMTINKSQGQTLDYVGLYLKQPAIQGTPTCSDSGTEYTTNIVYNEVLKKANLR